MIRAAMYLRSSKDRSDVSIDAQRRELEKLANERDMLIVQEYSDVVESAKSGNRPGFQDMVHDLRSPMRSWQALLMTDTSRLFRGQYFAQAFKHDAKKRGVEVIFSKLPEVDPITKVILHSTFEAMDEVHSLMSKEKGLAGMAENVRQGYRAGGRAPRGYRLKRLETGAVREGEGVIKTILMLSDDAPLVARYLQCRAQGVPRAKVKRDLGITWSVSSLVEIEWNALTYAGHTVWNVRNEKSPDGGYAGGKKRKPRAEWVIQHDTHPSLITAEEAESLLSALETSIVGKAVSRAKSGLSDYLLTGLLRAPDDEPWWGQYKYYRARGTVSRYVSRQEVDSAVLTQIRADMSSDAFVHALMLEARKYAEAVREDPAKELRGEVVSINAQVAKAMDLALQLADPAPALRKVDELEARRKAIITEIARREEEYARRSAVANITEKQVRDILQGFDFESLPEPQWKDLIRSLVERIELCPTDLTFRIYYRIAVSSVPMASPRGSATYTTLDLVRQGAVR